MPDPTNDSTGVNYARKDASAERLWLTQRTKANPWDHRAQSDEDDVPQGKPQAGDAKPEAPSHKAPMISQEDTAAFQREAPLENPFESLIEHRRQQKP